MFIIYGLCTCRVYFCIAKGLYTTSGQTVAGGARLTVLVSDPSERFSTAFVINVCFIYQHHADNLYKTHNGQTSARLYQCSILFRAQHRSYK